MIVFSDLDGTLLDHETYSYAAAEPALAALKKRHIPLILASSKTAPEIAAIRQDIGFPHCPAIVENGAGILAADETDAPDRSAYNKIRNALAHVPAELRGCFVGFGDLTDAQVSEQTGLTLENAKAARQRAFSEPGTWLGTKHQREAFISHLAKLGITAREGGRYLTLSLGTTKASQMQKILSLMGFTNPFSIALGDAPNDIEMLEAADRGFIVKNPHGNQLPKLPAEADGRITRTSKPGPAGWNDAILSLLDTTSNSTSDDKGNTLG